jgi:hypothetical protein
LTQSQCKEVKRTNNCVFFDIYIALIATCCYIAVIGSTSRPHFTEVFMTTAHTATPMVMPLVSKTGSTPKKVRIFDGNEDHFADVYGENLVEAQQVGEFIVRACNAYDKDQETVADLVKALSLCSAELFAQCGDQVRAMRYVEDARAVLAKAEGGAK